MTNNSNGILGKQKPIRSRRRRGTYAKWTVGALCLLVFAAIATLSITKTMQTPPRHVKTPAVAATSLGGPSPHWRIRVLPESAGLFPDRVLREIAGQVERQLRSGSQEELMSLARQIQHAQLLDHVQLVRTGEADIVVTLVPRTPLMRVEADRVRWLTVTSKVYGEAPLPAQESPETPLLRGVFDRIGRRFAMTDDQTLKLDHEETLVLQEAVELLQKSEKASFKIREMEFVRYRGFSIVLSGSETVVALGRAPFDSSLKHLASVLSTLEKRGSQAARIELDYSGKAFVKERKL